MTLMSPRADIGSIFGRYSNDQRIIDFFDRRKNRLGERIHIANIRVKQLLSKIDHQLHILDEREKMLFDRLVSVVESGDKIRSNIIASEIAQVREIKKHLLAFHIILENISLRLDNIILMGTIAKDIPQILGVVRELRNVMRGVMPNMEYELITLEENLQEALNEFRENTVSTYLDYKPSASSEAKKILEEAYLVAEERIRSSLPKPDKSDLEKNQSKSRT